MISFTEYNRICNKLNSVFAKSHREDFYLEDALEILESDGMLEMVTTGDIATVSKPIMTMKRRLAYESAPPDEEIEKWIKSNKTKFKAQYGDKYVQILYATAWTMYNRKRGKTDE